MKHSIKISISITLILFYSVLCRGNDSSSSEMNGIKTREIFSNLLWTKNILEKYGDSALKEIRDRNQTLKSDEYIFIYKKDGTCILHPDKSIEGTNRIQNLDEYGNPIAKTLLEGADKDGNWSRYIWKKPGSRLKEWKTVCSMSVKQPNGVEYVISNGAFDVQIEDNLVVGFVHNFVNLLKKKKSAAFYEFSNKSAKVSFNDVYIFILDKNGNVVFEPSFEFLEGKNLYNYQDYNNRYVFREIIDLALKKKSGWLEYFWENKNKNILEIRRTYVELVNENGISLIVAAGYFIPSKFEDSKI